MGEWLPGILYNNFKLELGNLNQHNNEGQLLEAIALQLHYYDTKRIHSALNTNPAAYAARFEQTEQEKQILAQQTTTGVRDKVMLEVGT